MAKLRSSNIEPSTGTTLALGASGDAALISSDSIKSNTWQDVGANSLWVSNGSGTLSNINSSLAGSGGFTLLYENSYASNSTADFSSTYINNTYDEYWFVMTNMRPNTDSVTLEFNGSTDNGSNYNVIKTTTFFSGQHGEGGANGQLNYGSTVDLAQSTAFQSLGGGLGNDADQSSNGILKLFSPGNTTYIKCFTYIGNFSQENNYTMNPFVAGYFTTATAVNAIRFKMSSGSFHGYIELYGIS